MLSNFLWLNPIALSLIAVVHKVIYTILYFEWYERPLSNPASSSLVGLAVLSYPEDWLISKHLFFHK